MRNLPIVDGLPTPASLVGSNLPVFFIRDAIKFPDVIHPLELDPATFRQEPNRISDLMSQTPESMHMLTFLISARGIPAGYRHIEGVGVNTYMVVNAAGETVLVKYHWHARQGVASLTGAEAAKVQVQDLGSASKELYDAARQSGEGRHRRHQPAGRPDVVRRRPGVSGQNPHVNFEPSVHGGLAEARPTGKGA